MKKNAGEEGMKILMTDVDRNVMIVAEIPGVTTEIAATILRTTKTGATIENATIGTIKMIVTAVITPEIGEIIPETDDHVETTRMISLIAATNLVKGEVHAIETIEKAHENAVSTLGRAPVNVELSHRVRGTSARHQEMNACHQEMNARHQEMNAMAAHDLTAAATVRMIMMRNPCLS